MLQYNFLNLFTCYGFNIKYTVLHCIYVCAVWWLGLICYMYTIYGIFFQSRRCLFGALLYVLWSVVWYGTRFFLFVFDFVLLCLCSKTSLCLFFSFAAPIYAHAVYCYVLPAEWTCCAMCLLFRHSFCYYTCLPRTWNKLCCNEIWHGSDLFLRYISVFVCPAFLELYIFVGCPVPPFLRLNSCFLP